MSAWSTITWDTARSAGFVAYGLLTLSVALGLALSQRWRAKSWPRWATTDLHRFVTLLALIFIAIHTAAIWLDPFMAFGPAEVLIPLVSNYRPVWVALGIVASYLLLAIWLSERLQKRVGYEWWRRLHYLAFVAFALCLIHGIATGSDTRTVWALWIYGGSVAIVGGLLALRLLAPPAGMRARPIVAGFVGTGVVILGIWALAGPLRPGWNAAANNGHGSGARVALSSANSTVDNASARVPTQSHLHGSIQQQGGVDEGSGLLIDARLNGGDRLEILLRGRPSVGGIEVTDGREAIMGPSGTTLCQGSIGAISGNVFSATCSGSAGTLQTQTALQISQNGSVAGTLRTSSA